MSPEVWDALETHLWPGNIRELRNLAQRFVVMDEDGRLTLADLPESIRLGRSPPTDAPDTQPLPYEDARAEALEMFQTRYVRRLLERSGGNISKAARMAGVSRRTVHRWLEGDSSSERSGAPDA